MSEPSNNVVPPPVRHRGILAIPIALIGGLILLLGYGIVRGNRTDSAERAPESPTSGAIAQLLKTDAGRTRIHAAIIVSASPARVWQLIADYDHFSDIFPNVAKSKGTQAADGRWHLTGEIHSVAGKWPLDIYVRHDESPQKRVASWDQSSGALKVNRGSWVVTPQGASETLLEYNLDLTVSPFPDFVVRAVLLDQLPHVLESVAHLAERATPR